MLGDLRRQPAAAELDPDAPLGADAGPLRRTAPRPGSGRCRAPRRRSRRPGLLDASEIARRSPSPRSNRRPTRTPGCADGHRSDSRAVVVAVVVAGNVDPVVVTGLGHRVLDLRLRGRGGRGAGAWRASSPPGRYGVGRAAVGLLDHDAVLGLRLGAGRVVGASGPRPHGRRLPPPPVVAVATA